MPVPEIPHRTAGGYYDSHFGDWLNHPVPNTLWDEISTTADLVLEESILSLSPTQGLRGVLPRMAEGAFLGREGEMLSPQRIAEEYPGFAEPVLTTTSRAELDMRWEREKYRNYLRAKLEGDSPLWDMGVNLGAGVGASFMDPVNWALAALSFGYLSWVPAFKGAHGLLTAARLGHAGLKSRGAAAALVGVEGLVQGAAYGTLLAAAKEAGGEYWDKNLVLEEALYSAGFGTVLGGAVYLGGGIPAVKRHSAAATAVMGRHFQKIMKDRRGGFDWGNSPVSWFAPLWRKMAMFSKGRNVDNFFPSAAEAVEKMRLDRTHVGRAVKRRVGGSKMEVRQDVASGHLKTGRLGFSDVEFTGKGMRRFKGWTAGRGTGGKPFYRGLGREPGVEAGPEDFAMPDRLYVRINDKHPPGDGRVLFFETPEGAVIEGLIAGRDKNGGNPEPGPYHVMEVRTARGIDPVPLEQFAEKGKDMPGKGVVETTAFFRSSGRVFEVRKDMIDPLIDAVSDEVLTYNPKEGWLSGDGKPSTDEMFSILNGQGEGATGPQIRRLMDVYYGSHFAEDGKNRVFLSEELGDIHYTDIDYVPDDMSQVREFRDGSFRFGMLTDLTDIRIRPGIRNIVMKHAQRAGEGRIRHLAEFVTKLRRREAENILEDALRELKAAGVGFPPRLDADAPLSRFPSIVLDADGAPVAYGGMGDGKGTPSRNAPVEDKSSWVKRIYDRDDLTIPLENVKFSLRPRSLRLDLHPMSWGVEEVVAMEGVTKGSKDFPLSDPHGDRTIFEGEGPGEWVGRNKVSLAALNIREVVWRGANDKIERIPIEGRYRPLLQADIRKRLGEFTKPDPETLGDAGGESAKGDAQKSPAQKEREREQKEKETAYLDRIKEAAGGGPEAYANNLLDYLGEYAGGDFSRKGYLKLKDEWRRTRSSLLSIPPDKPGYHKAMRDFRNMIVDLEIMADRLKMVWEGGLDKFGWFSDAEELLSLLRDSPETPYRFMGGDNVESKWTGAQMRLKVNLIRRLEEEVGEDALALLQRGVHDREISIIEDWMRRKMERDAGKAGTSTEDGREALDVSPTAWKMFNVLKEVMEKSQQHVIYSGYDRPALGEGVFIGSESWSRETIKRDGKTRFTRGLTAAADIKQQAAETIYENLTSIRAFPDATFHTLSDMEDRQFHRRIKWLSGEKKYDFLARYGSQGKAPEGRLRNAPWNFSSIILTNALYALEKDAKMAAVVSTFGNRPFLTLEMMGSAMKDKYMNKLDKRGLKAVAPYGTPAAIVRTLAEKAGVKSRALNVGFLEGQRLRVDAAVDWSVRTGARYLTNLLLGQPAAIKPLGKTVNAFRSLTNMNLLTTAFVTAGVSDLQMAAATKAKLDGKSGWRMFPELWKSTWEMLSDRSKAAVSPKARRKQRELGHRMGLAFSKDMEDMNARIDASAGRGIMSWAENKAMKGMLLPAVTDIGRGSSAMWASQGMGEALGKSYASLPEGYVRELNRYGIGMKEWELVRGLDAIRMEDGVPLVTLETIGSALYKAEAEGKLYRGSAERIFGMFEAFVGDYVRMRTSPQSGAWEMTVLSPNRDGDDWTNLAIKAVTQYLGVAMRQHRALRSIAAPREAGVRTGMFHENMAVMMAHATMMGGVSLMIASFLKGKLTDPTEDPHTFFLRSFAKSGALGLWGDYLLGETDPTKLEVLARLSGPTISGPGTEIAALGSNFFTGQWDRIPENGWDLLWKVFPSITGAHHLVLNTVLLEHWGAMSGDAKSRAAIRSRMRDVGETFIFED